MRMIENVMNMFVQKCSLVQSLSQSGQDLEGRVVIQCVFVVTVMRTLWMREMATLNVELAMAIRVLRACRGPFEAREAHTAVRGGR